MPIFGRSKKSTATTPPPAEAAVPIPAAALPPTLPPQQLWHNNPVQSVVPFNPNAQGPPGWGPPPHPFYQQIFVSNYNILQPPVPERPRKKDSKGKSQATMKARTLPAILTADMPSYIPGARIFNEGVDIPSFIPGARIFNEAAQAWSPEQYFSPQQHFSPEQYFSPGATLHDLISSKFNAVVTQIDGERFSGDERELWLHPPPSPQVLQVQPSKSESAVTKQKGKETKDSAACPIAEAVTSSNYFSKVNHYANSRMPSNLPNLKLYIPTFPLLCIAAQYSEHVYNKPSGAEREAHVDSDWMLGTKAMVIKSVPMDDMNVIVFAIRGSQSFLDWAVNLNSAPSSPEGFLDDPGNLCHTGFLGVARKMIKPVAARLRFLLEEDPRRTNCSLMITGHSAGGAIASLLFCHMLSTSKEASSELSILTTSFKRVHCVSFGAPPVSLLPLTKPAREDQRKSLFLSFVNEGDPVVRADKAYVKSLFDLYSSPAPKIPRPEPKPAKSKPLMKFGKSSSSSSLALNKTGTNAKPQGPVWNVPPATLSNAGRLILLRSVQRVSENGKKQTANRMDDGVQARIVTDEQLREVIWGDPVCHMMKIYARRIEVLATNAVVGRA